ncbi:type VI secretion system baseplate subunit TssG [Salmonella enterica subsp. indica]|uniref:Type VI secretion system baseplate subunit TssG n=2 Tax=Salmonella enterica TaxID=28901 RepID=A0A701ZIS8_SALER|nr:type VI secretion system baseplate subunit TssG [Salmonella enterica]EAW1720467.1 type VI secretion system baseplate subunit TssG [Salmonella enterica subsp. indica]EEJ9033700.1 type VI secretion system baseplate subunit TssG [Salmonella enterica subsp. enterica serovar Oslo]MBA3215970.1 type VI secretion system baseplate subunit TssG [Salmonella enterica]HAC6576742.1 type VI secretion system baseplate subunit TssG [Salmonella enterica subsp. indica]HBC0059894.1 type VI secretion system bas
MATYRPARPDVGETAPLPDVRGMNFYVLMEALYRRYGLPDSEPSLRTEPAQEVALFKSDASIAFPGSDLSTLERSRNGQFILTTKFLGFSGSQSPLPGYYLDRMARESAQNEEGLAAFLDLFSHRWTQFAYHAWRKYRYYICFRNGGTDAFSQRMYALVGLGNKSVRDKLAINHSKMLAYAGILATPGRSPDVVCNLVSHCFDLPDVAIESWQLRKVPVDPAQQNRLGVHNPKTKSAGYVAGRSVVGVNFTLGAKVPDRSGKFLLQLGNLSMARYLSFLPDGEHHQALTMFMSFLLRDQFAWDLKLCLAPNQARGMKLGDRTSSCIKRTAFIGQPKTPPSVTLHIRE